MEDSKIIEVVDNSKLEIEKSASAQELNNFINEYNNTVEKIGISSNEHYRNELSLQLSLSIINRELLLVKKEAEKTKLALNKICKLPWYKRLFKSVISDCMASSIKESSDMYKEDLINAEKIIESNENLLNEFITNAKLPEVPQNESEVESTNPLTEESFEEIK